MKNSALSSALPPPPPIHVHTHKPLGPELQSAPAPAAVFLHHLVHSINAKRDPHRGHGVLQSARRDRDGEPTLGAAAGSEDAHEAVAVGVGEEVVVGVVRDFGGCRFAAAVFLVLAVGFLVLAGVFLVAGVFFLAGAMVSRGWVRGESGAWVR